MNDIQKKTYIDKDEGVDSATTPWVAEALSTLRHASSVGGSTCRLCSL